MSYQSRMYLFWPNMTYITITLYKIKNIIVDQHIENYHNIDDVIVNLYLQNDVK